MTGAVPAGDDLFNSFISHSIHVAIDALASIESELHRAAESQRCLPFFIDRALRCAFDDLVRLRSVCEDSIVLESRRFGAHWLMSSSRFARLQGNPASLRPAMKSPGVNLDRNTAIEESPVGAKCEPAESILKSALAGGLACAFSGALMHPVDTLKTHVQTSTLSSTELVMKLPQIGLRGLYKGSIPAVIGQFSGHGLRMGIFEGSKLIMIKCFPSIPTFQVQSIASFCSTFLGTAARIPAEVLKQRLQAGLYSNVGEAVTSMLYLDGIKGFFRGTKATLLREVPFYVAGTGVYEEAKKVAQKLIGRELKPLETILVGGLSGGLTAVAITPLDVIKTKMMTAPQGLNLSMSKVAWTVLCEEGLLGLYRGAVPRFFWVAPLGAINFAGYEIVRKALDKM